MVVTANRSQPKNEANNEKLNQIKLIEFEQKCEMRS